MGFLQSQETAFTSLAVVSPKIDSLLSAAVVVNACDATTGWAAKNNDTTTLAVVDTRVEGLKAMSFKKVNGAAGTVFGAIARTVALDLSACKPWDCINFYIYLSALTDVATAYIRIGTDVTNYVEYSFADTILTAGIFNRCTLPLHKFTGSAGTCVNWASVTYVEVGATFDLESSTLNDILVDDIKVVPALLTV
jgi:hypothetical protein